MPVLPQSDDAWARSGSFGLYHAPPWAQQGGRVSADLSHQGSQPRSITSRGLALHVQFELEAGVAIGIVLCVLYFAYVYARVSRHLRHRFGDVVLTDPDWHDQRVVAVVVEDESHPHCSPTRLRLSLPARR